MPLPVSRTLQRRAAARRRLGAHRDAAARRVAHGVLDEISRGSVGAPSDRRRRVARRATPRTTSVSPFASAARCDAREHVASRRPRDRSTRRSAPSFPTRIATGRAGRRRCAACAAYSASIVSRNRSRSSVGSSRIAQRLGESADDGERRLELVRHVRDEVAANRLESAPRREIHARRAPRRRRAAGAR